MPLFIVPDSNSEDSAPNRLREFNPCHEPGGSAKGGQFAPKGTGDCEGGAAPAAPESSGKTAAAVADFESEGGAIPPTEPTPLPKSLTDNHTLKVLREGEITGAHDLGGGINVTAQLDLEDPDGSDDNLSAVFKPENGERWNGVRNTVRNREFSLAEREAAAYEVDQLLGTNLVPETILRDDVETDIEANDSGYSNDELQDMYREYREEQLDRVGEQVGDQMYELYGEARDSYVQGVKNQADRVTDLWNEVLDEHPEIEADEGRYGSPSFVNQQPVLPLDGTLRKFDPKHVGTDEADPLDILEKADVVLDAGVDRNDAANIKAVIRRMILDEGYRTLGDLDEEAVGEKFEYDDFIQNHADTEARLYDEAIPSFTDWKEQNGYEVREGTTASGRGSVQRFIDGADRLYVGDLTANSLYKFAVLDYAIGNTDRHSQNMLMGGDGSPYAIDHGYSFPSANYEFRSVPARYVINHYSDLGSPTTRLRNEFRENILKTDWNAFIERYSDMDQKERGAFLGRIAELAGALETEDGLYDLLRRANPSD